MGMHIIKMPDIGEGIAEVELAEWHVQPGDEVVEDQVLADVMTDKATVQVPSPVNGKVIAVGGKVGDVMAVGSELIRIEVQEEGAEPAAATAGVAASEVADESRRAERAASRAASPPQATRPAPSQPSTASESQPSPATAVHTEGRRLADERVPDAAPAPIEQMTPEQLSEAGGISDGKSQSREKRPSAGATGASPSSRAGKPLASPAVRKRAWDLGIELQFVAGTGKAGQITHQDLDGYLARGTGAALTRGPAHRPPQRDDEEEIPIVGLRRRIAERMQESKRRIPHFTYVEEIDMTEMEALRERLNRQWGETRGKLTLLPLLVRAMVLALREYPQINARYDDEAGTVTRYGAVHLGIAAQTHAGLMVPVLRHAEAMDLWTCAKEVARLAEAARSGKATREELVGSTITLTSLGALGGIVSTPVINHPEVAIVGVNRIIERPVIRNGAVVARKMMNLSSSFDHRVVDGMHAAEFIQHVKGLLEFPALLFVE